jgi:cell wall-associated NlpC family hydrolase
MVAHRTGCIAVLALAFVLACSGHAGATGRNWAGPAIRIVTQAGLLGDSPSSFAPQAALTQSALAAAIAATDTLQHPPLQQAAPGPLTIVSVTVANAPGAVSGAPAAPTAVPVVQSSVVTLAAPAAGPSPRALYRADSPARPVSIEQLDAALVDYLGLDDAAGEIQATLVGADLRPRPSAGTEAVARMLGLRLNHPAGQDDLELLPTQAATRAEAAWSFAQVLHLGDAEADLVRRAADDFTLPTLTAWQRRILATAISYVGFPYVWGGTSPTSQTLFGVSAPGGFDCSGFVWRIYKLTPYAGEGGLAGALRGRTTYDMSGEVPRGERVPAAQLEPGDVLFFGAHGRASKPSEVDHAALYLGSGWFVQSSAAGVTLLPLKGWYARNFAWARRPLREAGLVSS